MHITGHITGHIFVDGLPDSPYCLPMRKTIFYQSLLIGDSLALPLEGLSRGHAGTFVREVKDYIDAAPALKTGHHEWRKPALYSSLSQLCLTAALCSAGERLQSKDVSRVLSGAGMLDGTDSGPLRHPDRTVLNALAPALTGRDMLPPGTVSCPLPLAAASIAVQHSRFFPLDQILATLCLFCTEPHTVYASLLLGMLFRAMIHGETPLEEALAGALTDTEQLVTGSAPRFFSRGLNPAGLSACSVSWRTLARCRGIQSEEEIVKALRPLFKSPVTRATVEHPRAVFALAIALAREPRRTPDFLPQLLRLGGTLRPLCGTALAVHTLDMETGICRRR
jgi:hypothetical protein